MNNVIYKAVIEEMQNLEELGGVSNTKEYQDIMRQLISDCQDRLQNSYTMNNMEDMEHCEFASSVNSGGGMMVDFIYLKNGKRLGITEDCICLYNSKVEFAGDEDNDPVSMRQLKYENRIIIMDEDQNEVGLFIKRAYDEHTHDVIELKDGRAFALSNNQLSLYKNVEAITAPNPEPLSTMELEDRREGQRRYGKTEERRVGGRRNND